MKLSMQIECHVMVNLQADDGAGAQSKMCLWNHPGNDTTGMVARCEKVVNTCEQVSAQVDFQ